MKTTLLKISFIFLLLSLMGAGCEKKEEATSDDYVLIKDVIAEVANNDWQDLPSDELIWYFRVDEGVMLKIEPPRDNYLIPTNLQEDFKVKGLKILITGKVLLHELSSISKSYPTNKLAANYRFEIVSIKKLNN